ncbi:MAG: hypothetical protein MUP90_15410 [Gammaproteobacteria bacterium]|nr:hypothetical protein [Gammaproteobacteria bacterium]
MNAFTRLLLSLALACLTALSIHGCDSTSTSVHYSVGYGGYYGGAGWYDPYYRYPPVYGRPVGPPVYRPPSGGGRPPSGRPPSGGGGRPANMPSAARPAPRTR